MTDTQTTPTEESSRGWAENLLWFSVAVVLVLLFASIFGSANDTKPVVTTADNCVVSELRTENTTTRLATADGIPISIPASVTIVSTSCGLYVIGDNVRLKGTLKSGQSYDLIIGDSRTLLDVVENNYVQE